MTDAIEQRWGRAVPTDNPRFYVHTVIYERQVIFRFGNQATPRILSARIDFESTNPAAGVLHFFDADDHDLIGAADQLRGDFNRFIKDLSPGAGFREHQGPLIIATLDPAASENYQPRKPGQHRRRKP